MNKPPFGYWVKRNDDGTFSFGPIWWTDAGQGGGPYFTGYPSRKAATDDAYRYSNHWRTWEFRPTFPGQKVEKR